MKNIYKSLPFILSIFLNLLPVQAESQIPPYRVRIPVYHLTDNATEDQFYTADRTERENLIMEGWNDEGISFYETSQGSPVYCLRNPETSLHYYTADESEKQDLLSQGWSDEGTAFLSDRRHRLKVYAVSDPGSASVEYIASEEEYQQKVSEGKQDRGFAFYAAAHASPNAKLQGYYHYSLPYYSQLDARWSDIPYGSYTFGHTGCVPTSLAMCIEAIKGQTVLPTDTGNYAHTYSNFDNRNAGSSDTVVVDTAAYYGVHCDNIQSLDQLTDALKHGKPCVIVVDGGNAFMSGTVAHCVVMHGYDNGTTQVSDPFFACNCKAWDISFMWSIRTQQSYLLDNSPYYCYALY